MHALAVGISTNPHCGNVHCSATIARALLRCATSRSYILRYANMGQDHYHADSNNIHTPISRHRRLKHSTCLSFLQEDNWLIHDRRIVSTQSGLLSWAHLPRMFRGLTYSGRRYMRHLQVVSDKNYYSFVALKESPCETLNDTFPRV
jgi:hypothetical protein